jgi:hypothetical protein
MIISTYERPAVAVFPRSGPASGPDGERNTDHWTGEA